MLTVILQELSWIAAERAVKDAKFVESWKHFAKGAPWFEPYPKQEFRRLLIGRFLAAITINAWLIVLGRMLYQLEDYIESAFDLFVEYDAEIKALDVGTFELMFEKLSNYEDDQGHYIAKLKMK